MSDIATRPDLSEASQKERALWHMKQVGEIDRKIALQEYDIGRLAARIRDLRDEGYVIDSRKDDDGIAHYSLVAEPGESASTEREDESGTVSVETAGGLLDYLDGTDQLAYRYVRLLEKAATQGYPVGAQEDTEWEAEALSDWDAAMCISKDVTVAAITETREKLCRAAPVVEEHGHRKGQATYRLNEDLT